MNTSGADNSVILEGVIHQSFGRIQRPDTIVSGKPFGCDLTFVQDFNDLTWQQLSEDVAFLNSHCDFAHVVEEAICYFLPAYMVGSLHATGVDREQLVLFLWSVLCPPVWADLLVERRRRIFCLLADGQRRAVAMWLEYWVGVDSALLAPQLEYGEDSARRCIEIWASGEHGIQ